MFTGKTAWEIFQAGGITIYILLGCSILSFAVAFNRWLVYRGFTKDLESFCRNLKKAISSSDWIKGKSICASSTLEVSKALSQILPNYANNHGLKAVSDRKGILNHELVDRALERAITAERLNLEKFTPLVGSIGAIAVYIGLFGTVLGIIRAFNRLVEVGPGGSKIAIAGLAGVIPGIAEALICTAAGLAVAVPSVVLYNYFMNVIERLMTRLQIETQEMSDLVLQKDIT